ncbi:SatD family protein [Microbacterium sp. P06]|uniref:SatD family protein n=1 Tax=Microbacterium sp. P06 TaxID=3366949 RepID=UPI003744B7AB
MDFAVIADIVGSRRLADRGDAQLAIERTVLDVERDYGRAVRRLAPTVGDEFQGVYGDLTSTLTALLLLQLRLPAHVEVRFGVGVGEVRSVASTGDRAIEDGPGWWAARQAIETVHRLEESRVPRARTWVTGGDEPAPETAVVLASVNAYLMVKDHLVGGMGDRARRLAYGTWLGRSQESLAAEEGVTQSAVSQALARSGSAALFLGLHEISSNLPEGLK